MFADEVIFFIPAEVVMANLSVSVDVVQNNFIPLLMMILKICYIAGSYTEWMLKNLCLKMDIQKLTA